MIPFVILTIESEDDRAYMTLIYQRHQALMLKTAWEYTRDKSDVEDIVSNSCVALINHLQLLRTLEEQHLRKYIVITVRSKALDLLRKQQKEILSTVPLEECAAHHFPSPDNTEKKVLLLEELRQLQTLLQALPEKERDVLRLKYQHGLKHKEIAEQLGITEATVTTYVKRAKAFLQSAMY